LAKLPNEGYLMSAISKSLKEKPTKRALILSLPILLLLLPVFSRDYYILQVLIFANIYAVLAASWDILAGVTGIFSFGQVLFFGAAAYMSAALNLYVGLPPLVTIPLGGAFGVVVGLTVALPSLRLKGPYFSIISLIFPGILAGIIYMYPQISGGDSGIYGLDPISSAPVPYNMVVTYYASLLLMLASILTLLRIANSSLGLIFKSIRDDEDAAEASGINTTKYKFVSFAISGFFAGIAGSFQTHLLMSVSPSMFSTTYSFQAILGASLGGIGTIFGSAGGAYLIAFLNESLRGLADYRVLVSAIVLVLVFRYLPGGIIRQITKHYNIRTGIWSKLKKLWRNNQLGTNS
jgi:branched-chain amino acid transport system permease protein